MCGAYIAGESNRFDNFELNDSMLPPLPAGLIAPFLFFAFNRVRDSRRPNRQSGAFNFIFSFRCTNTKKTELIPCAVHTIEKSLEFKLFARVKAKRRQFIKMNTAMYDVSC